MADASNRGNRRFGAVVVFCVLGAGCMKQDVDGKTAAEAFASPRTAALAEAACRGDASAVKREVADGADPNGVGLEGVTPLFWAQKCENLIGMKALLAAGADPNKAFPGPGGFSPVGAAASAKNTEILKTLLEHGGDPNAAYTASPWTALKVAMSHALDGGGWDNYYALLEAGADINRRHAGETIAEFAAAMGAFDKVEELLDRGYDTDLEDLGGMVQARAVYPPDPSAAEKAKVVELLKQRGVRFPVRPGVERSRSSKGDV